VTDTPPPPGPPPGPPPEQPPGPPPQPQWQQPGWPQPPYGSQPQQWGAPPFAPPKKTNGLAIASLVLGLAWVVVGPLGFFTGIAAVITGHIARKQIREREENGGGMALAGLILGYISVVISILAVIGLSILFFAVIPNLIEDEVQDDARDFGQAVVAASIDEGGTPRGAQRLREVYRRVADPFSSSGYRGGYGCCDDDVIRLADGTPIEIAPAADRQRNDWQVEFEQTFLGDKVACLTSPAQITDPIVVTKGRCSG
jgi:hypothetical protein